MEWLWLIVFKAYTFIVPLNCYTIVANHQHLLSSTHLTLIWHRSDISHTDKTHYEGFSRFSSCLHGSGFADNTPDSARTPSREHMLRFCARFHRAFPISNSLCASTIHNMPLTRYARECWLDHKCKVPWEQHINNSSPSQCRMQRHSWPTSTRFEQTPPASRKA